MLLNLFQEDLLHNLPRRRREAHSLQMLLFKEQPPSFLEQWTTCSCLIRSTVLWVTNIYILRIPSTGLVYRLVCSENVAEVCSYAAKMASVNSCIRLRSAYNGLHMAKLFCMRWDIWTVRVLNIGSLLNFGELNHISYPPCSSVLVRRY